MKARIWLTATVLAALLAPGVARAEGLEGRFSIAFQGGTQSMLGGDLMKGGRGLAPRQARHHRVEELPRRVRAGPAAAGAAGLRNRRADRDHRPGHLVRGRRDGAGGRDVGRQPGVRVLRALRGGRVRGRAALLHLGGGPAQVLRRPGRRRAVPERGPRLLLRARRGLRDPQRAVQRRRARWRSSASTSASPSTWEATSSSESTRGCATRPPPRSSTGSRASRPSTTAAAKWTAPVVASIGVRF